MVSKVRLIADEKGCVRDTNGKFLFSVPMTERAEELLDNDGWDKTKESWLSYRKRTEKLREVEEAKKVEFAKDIVNAYNEKHFEPPTEKEGE